MYFYIESVTGDFTYYPNIWMWLQKVFWVNDYDILFQTFNLDEFSTNNSWLFRGMILFQYSEQTFRGVFFFF